ncbi:glycoside hydrolase [bacterium]|nr:glycoside hydrolase [bacterium]
MSRGDLMRVLCLIAPLLCVGFAVHAGEAPVDWQTDRRLTNEPGASELSINFARPIAADEHNGVHIVWHNSLNGKTQVYYMRSVNGGTTWNARRRLSQSPHENQFPAIAVSGANVYVVWFENDNNSFHIYFRQSPDLGATWLPPVRLSQSGASAYPSIAASGSNLHVVWGENRYGNAEIHSRSSRNRGLTWEEERLVSELPYESWVGTTETSSGNVYAAWVDYRDANEEQYFRRSTDGGRTWDPVIRLTRNRADSWAPSMMVDGRTLHICWFDRRNAGSTDQSVETQLVQAMSLLGLPSEPAPPRDPSIYYLADFYQRIQLFPGLWLDSLLSLRLHRGLCP